MRRKLIILTVMLFMVGTGSLQIGPSQAGAQSADQPPFITAVESGEYEILLADASQKGQAGSNLNAIYDEMKELVKEYKKARDNTARERIHNRAQDLMSQLFDAKVQFERKKIQKAEERLNHEKQKLADMQSHKQDLVHAGVQKALNEGQLPEWAPKKNETMQ